MTMPLILTVVIVSTKHLLHMYHCQQRESSMFTKFYIQSPDNFLSSNILLKWVFGFEIETTGTAPPALPSVCIHNNTARERKIASLLFMCIIVNIIKQKAKMRLHIFQVVKGQ